MARPPIRPVGEDPKGDDMPWKREVERVLEELIQRQQDDRNDINYLKGLG